MLHMLLLDESGFIVSAELVLVFTLIFSGTVVGMALVRDAIVQELGDVAEAIGALAQSYISRSVEAQLETGGVSSHASLAGSAFNDEEDDCDGEGFTFALVCGRGDPGGHGTAEATN